MSLNHLTSSTPENKWLNIGANDIKCQTLEVAGGTTFSNAFTINESTSSQINGNVASGVPLLICVGTNNGASNNQVGIACQNVLNRSIKLVSTNAPSTGQSIWADDNLNLVTFSNPGTISITPNSVTTLSTNQTNTSIATPLSLPAQQYLELNLTGNQSIVNATTSPLFYNVTVKNVGDIGYAASVVTINTTGTYNISYYATFASNADNNNRTGSVIIGGINYALNSVQNGNGSTTVNGSVSLFINALSTFTISVAQSSGGALLVTASRLNIARIA